VQTLREHKILSVPVRDTSLAKPRYTAFVGVVDVLAHVVSQVRLEDLSDPEFVPALFHKYTAADLIDESGRDKFSPVESSASLEIALKLMVKWGVHRIPIIDAEGTLETLVTQSQVVKYLAANTYLLGSLRGKTVEELDLGTREVLTIQGSSPVVDAFRLIREKVLTIPFFLILED